MSVMTAELSQMERDAIDPHVAFAELSKIMLGAEPLNLTLERIAELARATMPDVDEVSMTLLEGGKAKTAVFTGPLAVQLDERQYDTGFGPCLDAAVSGQTIGGGHQRPRRGLPRLRRSSAGIGRHLLGVGRIAGA